MIGLLLSHQWKSFWRSRNAGKNVAVQIFMGFLFLYFLTIAILVGLGLESLLKQIFPAKNTIEVFCGFILYYFSFDVLLRFTLQELPTLAIQPYLVQNIRRKQIVNFLNWRSLFTFLNALPLFLFIPFSIKVIGGSYGGLTAAAFVIAIISLCVFNHFLVLFIKRKTIINSWWLVGFFAITASLIACDYFHIFSAQKISSFLFTILLKQPWLTFLSILMAVGAFTNNSRYLRQNLYIEEITKASAKQKNSTEYAWLQRFGNVGDLVATDIKLILRNKRPRSVLMLSFVFLGYGFIFYKKEYLTKGSWGMILMGASFITGIFMAIYGQFLLAWQSAHFDGFMAANMNIRIFLKSKLILLVAMSTISLLLSLPYGLLDWHIIPIQIAAYFFNVGIHSIVCVFIATYNYKGLDLGKAATFNYQGTGAAQWLYSIVILILGTLLYLPFSLLFNPWVGVAALGILGLISLLLQEWWLDILVRQFTLRKYKILDGFREK